MEKRNIYILRGLALILLSVSFFLEISYLSKSFLLSGVVISALLFNKKMLNDIQNKSLPENLLAFLLVVLVTTGISFILLSDSNLKTKASIGCLLLLLCIWRFLKRDATKG